MKFWKTLGAIGGVIAAVQGYHFAYSHTFLKYDLEHGDVFPDEALAIALLFSAMFGAAGFFFGCVLGWTIDGEIAARRARNVSTPIATNASENT